MAGAPQSPRAHAPHRSARRALAGVGAVLLTCALIGTFIHPEAPPPGLAALERSEGVSSSVGEGPQFCGRHGAKVGYEGSYVIELWIDGREHCVVVYPASEQERQRFASLPRRPSLTAWHGASMVWQVESAEGMLVGFDTKRAQAEAALHHHRVRQAWLLGVGLMASAGSVGLGLRARGARARSASEGLT